MAEQTIPKVPSAFIWRRVHSLMGFWLVIYLTEHLLTNSQATLWLGDKGIGFINMVNLIQRLPYLQVIEIVLLGIPIAIHGVWGIKYALSAKFNSKKSDGSTPSLPNYARNKAFSWQRITSWILLLGIILHVFQMRFYNKPVQAILHNEKYYLVKVSFDAGLYTLAPKLGVQLIDPETLQKGSTQNLLLKKPVEEKNATYNFELGKTIEGEQSEKDFLEWEEKVNSFSLRKNEVIAQAKTPGTAILLTTRDTFKSPLMGILYSVFVLAAVFHACNGLWTFLISWGVILSYRSQNTMVRYCYLFMLLLAFLGLAAIWGSYWINLRS